MAAFSTGSLIAMQGMKLGVQYFLKLASLTQSGSQQLREVAVVGTATSHYCYCVSDDLKIALGVLAARHRAAELSC